MEKNYMLHQNNLQPVYQRLSTNNADDAMKENNPHCFVVVSKKESSTATKWSAKVDTISETSFNFLIDSLYNIRQKNHLSIDFFEVLDVNTNEDPIPQGITPNLSTFTRRYTVEFSLSIDKIKTLLTDITSEWHGQIFDNPEKIKKNIAVLTNNLIDFRMELKNEKNNKWEVYQSLLAKYKKQLEEKSKNHCQIL
jgi:hypothetical protein